MAGSRSRAKGGGGVGEARRRRAGGPSAVAFFAGVQQAVGLEHGEDLYRGGPDPVHETVISQHLLPDVRLAELRHDAPRQGEARGRFRGGQELFDLSAGGGGVVARDVVTDGDEIVERTGGPPDADRRGLSFPTGHAAVSP